MRGAGDELPVRRHLGRDLHGDVRFALVVEHDHLVGVFRLGVGVAKLHREVGGVAAAKPVGRDAAGERPDEADLHLVLGCCRRSPCDNRREGDKPG